MSKAKPKKAKKEKPKQLSVAEYVFMIAEAKEATRKQRRDNAAKRKRIKALAAEVSKLDAKARGLFWKRENQAARKAP